MRFVVAPAAALVGVTGVIAVLTCGLIAGVPGVIAGDPGVTAVPAPCGGIAADELPGVTAVRGGAAGAGEPACQRGIIANRCFLQIGRRCAAHLGQ